MNLNAVFFYLCIAVLLCSCASNKKQTVDMKFIDCLPSEVQVDYLALVTAFDSFLLRDYNGSIEQFTQTIIDLNLSSDPNLTKQDIELGRILRINNFTEYIYSTFNDTTYHSVFSKIEGKPEKKTRIRKLMKVDKKKPYLACILEVMTSDDPLRSYIEAQEINSVSILIQDFSWKPGYDISTITQSGILKIMFATELYSGMLMRS